MRYEVSLHLQKRRDSLNPYSNGIYSVRLFIGKSTHSYDSLNPYSNGIYSVSSVRVKHFGQPLDVLILILMEYTL